MENYKTLNVSQKAKRYINILKKLLPLVSFIIPFSILYSLDPNSFEATWKGRTFYLFFLWLISLETILSWEELRPEEHKLRSIRALALIIAFALPTIYVVAANYCGLNAMIVSLARKNNIMDNAGWMPLSTEYLVFTALFALTLSLNYGVNRLKDASISTLFLGMIGMIYTIDNLFPWGRFTPFQILVPTTAALAANVLTMMGYKTTLYQTNRPTFGPLTHLNVKSSNGISTGFDIAWPCSGVESLLIYTVTILLFLRKSGIPRAHRIIYFAIGAIVTYFINVLRIVTIFVISINTGGGLTKETLRFHDFYGQLYSIIWIICYPLIIMGVQFLWNEIKISRNKKKQT